MQKTPKRRPPTGRAFSFALALGVAGAFALPGTLAKARAAADSKGKAPMSVAIEIDLKIVEAKREGDKWSVLAELTFHNRGQKDFELDKEAAVAAPRHLGNHLFAVRQGAKKIEYTGIMKKRAPPGPDGFLHIAPGGMYKVTTQLAGDYALPSRGGEFSVALDVPNHFSKDDVDLKSNVAHFTLVDPQPPVK